MGHNYFLPKHYQMQCQRQYLRNPPQNKSCDLYFPGTTFAMRPLVCIHVVLEESALQKIPLLAAESSHFIPGSTRTEIIGDWLRELQLGSISKQNLG